MNKSYILDLSIYMHMIHVPEARLSEVLLAYVFQGKIVPTASVSIIQPIEKIAAHGRCSCLVVQ
jgi:hypothetical protein